MFADRAAAAMVEELRRLGARQTRLVAKIVGGANIFVGPEGVHSPLFDIGRRNIEALRSALQRLNLPVVAQDVGGTCGRSLEFSVHDGSLYVRTLNGTVKTL
jgi:chemotaxis protein CheD